MAQTEHSHVLANVYEQRIGPATNLNEVMGYWIYLVGTILGALGIVTFALSTPASMVRGVGYALIAVSPALILSGATFRFPLEKLATTLVTGGMAITLGSIAWFILVFPRGWSLTTGHSGIIAMYTIGLATIGIAGTIVPLVTNNKAQMEVDAANERARTSEQETDRLREELSQVNEKVSALEGVSGDDHDVVSSKAEFEMYKDEGGQWRWRLTHDNGNIIADGSEGYSSKANARKGLESVKLNALGAEIVEV